jgi:hypothetical protein
MNVAVRPGFFVASSAGTATAAVVYFSAARVEVLW